jgi:hypothetical protein
MLIIPRRRVVQLDPDNLLLISGKGANNSTAILDSSYYGRTITVSGDAKITTAVADPFGASDGVLAFDGNGDALQPAYTSALDLTSPYTIEFFFRRTSTSDSGLFGKGGAVAGWNTTNGIEITAYILGGVLYVQRYIGGTTLETKSTSPPATNTWAHFAVSYDGTTVRNFLAGAMFGSSTVAPVKPTTSNIYTIGAHVPLSTGGALFHAGQMAQFRHRVGAVYTANFTPPAAPFTP